MKTLIEEAATRPALRARMIGAARRHGAATQEEAEDCVQDALITALTTRAELLDESRLDAWLVQIAINAARMHQRSLGRVRRGGGIRHVDVDVSPIAAYGNPERTAAERESLASIDRSLQERDWDLLDASLAWDGTLAAYANARGEKVTTLKVRLHRLRERLKVLVEAA
jgi:RNA polymerase sigma factor (sigma-70 family)